jgi:tRNA modification GTPase
VCISALTGAGIELLKSEILRCIGFGGGEEGVFLARERHVLALKRALGHIAAAESTLGQIELVAEELRLADDALGEITGRVTPDELLGQIFARFCIGK